MILALCALCAARCTFGAFLNENGNQESFSTVQFACLIFNVNLWFSLIMGELEYIILQLLFIICRDLTLFYMTFEIMQNMYLGATFVRLNKLSRTSK